MSYTPFDFSDDIAGYTRDFAGREWAFVEMNQWWAESDGPRFFIITGAPGVGKTAMAARLTEIYDIAAIHFCTARSADTIDPLNFARSISSQLLRIAGFAQYIVKDSNIILQPQQNIRDNYGRAINMWINNLIVNASSPMTAFIHAVFNLY